MPIQILATKLYVPPPPAAVRRPRLIERLNEGLHRKLTIISASAGFGKSTLLAGWLHDLAEGVDGGRGTVVGGTQTRAATDYLPSSTVPPLGTRNSALGTRVSWLSLDEADSDPTRFLIYLVAAVKSAHADIAEGILDMLQSPQPPTLESVLTALLNEITTIAGKFVLVLDDYHVVDARVVDDAIAFMIEHLPPQMHLVIATREDPRLPLARLRARNQLTELRAADLRVTLSEAAEFLHSMGLRLSAEDVAALEDRTEGWIAGLQLAALSMQGRHDLHGFIQGFAGDHRFIVDYLVEEVLRRQPEDVRDFLLQTSILDRLSAPLCDAVTGQGESQARLEAMERGNLFVVPLDDRRYWYRYHHLFAEVLRAHLSAEKPKQVPALRKRASEWFEQNGYLPDAIRHALAAQDFERAAGLVELALPEMTRTRQEATLLGWLKAIPDEVVRNRPVLSARYAGVLLACGEFEGVEARLRDAERWLYDGASIQEQFPSPPVKMVVMDDAEYSRLPDAIAMFRAGLALAVGDLPGTMKYARRVLDLVPEDDQLLRGGAAGLLGLAYWASGDLEAAYRSFAEGMNLLRLAGNISDAVGGSIALADLRIGQGRLREALSVYEHALQLAARHGEPAMRGTADMYVGMSELEREHNDLHAATQLLLRSKEQGEHTGFPQYPYRWRVAMARIRQTEGDLDGALELFQEAERLYLSDLYPNVHPIPALKARVWIAQGRLNEALAWANDRGLSVEDELSYLREYEHVTLTRVLLARSRSDGTDRWAQQAIELLDRLLQAAQQGERNGSVIEVLVLLALGLQAQGDIPAALLPLQRALALAEREGYVRTFADEGAPMSALLEEAAKHHISATYVRHLLTAFGRAEDRIQVKQALIEPLSERELAVLRLLGSDLSGPEIARELMVSTNTMHTHTKSIYAKLGVNNRRAAVRRAEELRLL